MPLYLRQFRGRGHAPRPWSTTAASSASSRAWAEVTRTKEIVPERRDQLADVDCDIYLVRHGETQGYSSESGLTPLGSWQAHRRGQELARRVHRRHEGRACSARPPTAPARPREHLRRGLLDNVALFGTGAPDIGAIHDDPNFRNFEVATPDGPRDVTSAFRTLPPGDGEVRAGRPRRAARAGWSTSTASGASSRAAATRSRTGSRCR